MKFPNTLNVLSVLALGAGLLMTMAFAQGHGPGERGPGGPPPPDGGRMRLHFLDLSDAQKAQVKTIQDTEDAQAEAYFDKLREAHEALEAATAKGQFNEAQVRALAAAIAQSEIELTVIRARKDAAIYQVLTAEQRAKLDQFHAEHEAHRPPPPRPEQERLC
ncbi:MAG: Spy/CpxP family protein refolding chaperone [Acidobacteria bacterium]|nr:Spy/CpxP family protein refolding chaperone [Acidobacteriota bacterium]MBI3427789.1 Spy/CpxP family protein refolding chaperone [Acidobacteriota bacterium]